MKKRQIKMKPNNNTREMIELFKNNPKKLEEGE